MLTCFFLNCRESLYFFIGVRYHERSILIREKTKEENFMKQMLKRRIAIMLSLLFVLPNVLGVLPMATLETKAEESSFDMWWRVISDSMIFIEEGKGFYLGDYITIQKENEYIDWMTHLRITASMEKVKYYSSDPEVATIDSNGFMQTLKPGYTTITVTYKDALLCKMFEVVEKGTIVNTQDINKLSKAAKKLSANMPSKITAKNGFNCIKLYDDFVKVEKKVEKSIYYGKKGGTQYLVVPEAGRGFTLQCMLWQYSCNNSPVSTRSAKLLKTSSISASSKKNAITVKFKKKVTKAQILAKRINGDNICRNSYSDREPSSQYKLPKNQAYIQSSVYDLTTGIEYKGIAKITQGKKTATMYIYTRNKSKRAKLKKGHTYRLGSIEWDLFKGRKVKAK